jgi:hypothetical protein
MVAMKNLERKPELRLSVAAVRIPVSYSPTTSVRMRCEWIPTRFCEQCQSSLILT